MASNSKATQEDLFKLSAQMRKDYSLALTIPNTSWRVSVIDLGYNSLKMVSYEVRPDGSFRAYNQRGELTKIGEGLDSTKRLSREGMERTLEVLTIFNEINRMEKVDRVLAVATSAVREARNGTQFVRMADEVNKIKFRVLTRKEEALYSYIGGIRATNHPTVLFFDLGGGSIELTYAKNRKVKKLLSLPLGALRLSEEYGLRGGGYTRRDYSRLRLKIQRQLPNRIQLDLDDDTVLIGVGGTVRALARYDQWRTGYQLNKIHNYLLQRDSITESHRILRDLTTERISRIDSFGKDRAETISTGSLIIAMLMEGLEFEDLTVSTHGLRDGVLTQYLNDPDSFSHGTFGVRRANSFMNAERTQDSKTKIILDLFHLGLLKRREKLILEEAVGNFMDLYLTTRPETLFYSIISLDSVLNHQEQLAAAILLVRAKSPKMARWYLEHYSSILRDINKDSIYRMSAVAALNEILHMTGSKAAFSVARNELRIEVDSVMGKAFPSLLLEEVLEKLELEMNMKVNVLLKKGVVSGGVTVEKNSKEVN